MIMMMDTRMEVPLMDTKVEEGGQVTTNLPKTTNNLTEIPEQTNSKCCKTSILLVSITVNILLLLYIVAILAAICGKYRVFHLWLYENKCLLGHQKCTFKS